MEEKELNHAHATALIRWALSIIYSMDTAAGEAEKQGFLQTAEDCGQIAFRVRRIQRKIRAHPESAGEFQPALENLADRAERIQKNE